jgi:hypothetical protein
MWFGFKRTEKSNGITWDQLVDCEPRLADVLTNARAVKPTSKKARRKFDYDRAFADLRRAFEGLVGMYRRPEDAVLSSHAAWAVTFARIYEELHRP